MQHMAECRAHAVMGIPDVRDHWLPRVHQATVRSLAIPKIGSFDFPHHQVKQSTSSHTCSANSVGHPRTGEPRYRELPEHPLS